MTRSGRKAAGPRISRRTRILVYVVGVPLTFLLFYLLYRWGAWVVLDTVGRNQRS